MLDKLFDKQIYTIGFKVNGGEWLTAKVLADGNKEAERIIKEEVYHKSKEILFNDYNPYEIESVSDYINETTIKGLLLERDIIMEEE